MMALRLTLRLMYKCSRRPSGEALAAAVGIVTTVITVTTPIITIAIIATLFTKLQTRAHARGMPSYMRTR